jgi:hypothetical protein
LSASSGLDAYVNITTAFSYNPGTNAINVRAVKALYGDLAEGYAGEEMYAPGTVVVIGGSREIALTTRSHDTKVLGVISTNPAYMMNGRDAENVYVGLTGRVPCRVQGPIAKNTILVTSNIPGVAQALDINQFVPGCIIGKSLQAIESNTIETVEVVLGRSS